MGFGIMKVKELIKSLKQCHSDAIVRVNFGEDRNSRDIILEIDILESTEEEVILG